MSTSAASEKRTFAAPQLIVRGPCASATANGVALWPGGGGVEREAGTSRGRQWPGDRQAMHTGRGETVTGSTAMVDFYGRHVDIAH